MKTHKQDLLLDLGDAGIAVPNIYQITDHGLTLLSGRVYPGRYNHNLYPYPLVVRDVYHESVWLCLQKADVPYFSDLSLFYGMRYIPTKHEYKVSAGECYRKIISATRTYNKWLRSCHNGWQWWKEETVAPKVARLGHAVVEYLGSDCAEVVIIASDDNNYYVIDVKYPEEQATATILF